MKPFFSLILALWLCLTAMTACSAAEVPAPDSRRETGQRSHDTARTVRFSDVPADAWYSDAVTYCRQHGIMGGTSTDTFSLESALTRGMLAAILYRMSGSPGVSDPPVFPDAAAGSWCRDAVSWAAKRGVISGYGGVFGVNDPATREQAVTILWRYAGSPEGAEEVSDAAKVSAWAREALRWADVNGILEGMTENGRFDPKAAIKRGEAASMLYHYLRIEPADSRRKITLSAGGRRFEALLYDTPAADALWERLPMTVTMQELNGNEKYCDLPDALPANAVRPETIQAGDLMLFGSDCLVLFYQSFPTAYSYTPLGRLADPAGLAQALGGGSTEVTLARRAEFYFETRSVTLSSGYEMPLNGLGTYSLRGETCVKAVKSALASGVRLIDTASAYGNEEEVGRAIREAMEELGLRREEIFVTTKIYPGSEMANPETAIQACLDRLGLDYVDMMLLHHPDPNDVKAYRAMEQFVKAGKIRSLGLSNWYVKELETFLPQVTRTPALVQNEIHPYYQENDVIPCIQDLGIVVQGWYPLGGRGHTAELLGDEVISGIALAHGVSSAQVILRWNLQKGVAVIPGSSNPDHIRENTQLYDFALSDEEMAQINALDRNEKHDWY